MDQMLGQVQQRQQGGIQHQHPPGKNQNRKQYRNQRLSLAVEKPHHGNIYIAQIKTRQAAYRVPLEILEPQHQERSGHIFRIGQPLLVESVLPGMVLPFFCVLLFQPQRFLQAGINALQPRL